MQVEIHSFDSIERLARHPFAPGTSLISIGDTDAAPPVLAHRPDHILRLQFDDVMLEGFDYETGGAYAFRLFSEKQARRIADFVYRHLEDTAVVLWQCHFGQSRSAAVAAAIKEHFDHNGIEIFADELGRYCPNVLVFRKTLKALNEKRDGQR